MSDRYEKHILNGKFKLVTEGTEFRMALWINGFGIQNAATNEFVIPLLHSFNLDRFEEEGDTVKIEFRIYPNGSKSYQVAINPFQKTFWYQKQLYATRNFEEFFRNQYEKDNSK